MTRLTDDAIAAIRARAEAATPGPWRVVSSGSGNFSIEDVEGVEVAEVFMLGDVARFLAAARTDVPALLAHIAALGEESKAWHDECREAEQQRDTLAAKLAEVERERDEARDRYQRLTGDWSRLNESYDRLHGGLVKAESERSNYLARLANRTEERDAALAEQRRLAAEVERMRPVVDAAVAWHEQDEVHDDPEAYNAIAAAVDAYRAAPQPPAADVCPHCGGTGQVATMEAGCGAYVDCICAPGPGYESLATAIRSLPDEEPPSGYVERAEVRRCEQAVVEAAERVVAERQSAIRHARATRHMATLSNRLDALRVAREKAGE